MNTCPHPDIEADPIGPGVMLGWYCWPMSGSAWGDWDGVRLGGCKALRLLDF